jgi:alpha-tubulin suppressor-like RCC1 family protein
VKIKDLDGTLVPLSGVTAIAAGGFHSLALDDKNNVWVWGYNRYGQLGDGTKTNRLTPVQVKIKDIDGTLVPLSGVAAIAAGGFHSLALDSNSMALVWGRNNFGQLGDGTKTNRLTPTPVGISASALAGGWYHTLAINKDNGGVWSWGRNNNGQLGNGKTKGSLTPVQVDLSAKILAAGAGHSLALKDNGEVWTWGKNSSGQLGDGTTKRHSAPLKVMGEQAINDEKDVVLTAGGW